MLIRAARKGMFRPRVVLAAIVITAGALLPLAGGVADQPQAVPGAGHGFLIDKHMAAGLTCDACHKTTPIEPTAMSTCLSCHGGTYGKLAAMSASHYPNPHQSHQGAVPCAACHHVHMKSENFCSRCHHEFGFKVP